MALEDIESPGKLIKDLVKTNPVGASDTKDTLDNHIRGIKNTLLNTFPSVTGVITSTHTELNYTDGVTSAIQTQLDGKMSKTVANTISTSINMQDNQLDRPYIKDWAEYVTTVGASGASQALDYSAGTWKSVTLTANCTFTFTNPPASGRACAFTLELIQGGSGSYTVTWPAAVKWSYGVAPTLSTGIGEIDIFTFTTRNAGSTWYGFQVGAEMA